MQSSCAQVKQSACRRPSPLHAQARLPPSGHAPAARNAAARHATTRGENESSHLHAFWAELLAKHCVVCQVALLSVDSHFKVGPSSGSQT